MVTGLIREHLIKRFTRSPKWPRVRKNFLKEHPKCAVCERRHNLQVHHIIPVHIKPDLELDPNNLITLCGRCHLLFGHLNNWKHYNYPKEVFLHDVNYWNKKIKLTTIEQTLKEEKNVGRRKNVKV